MKSRNLYVITGITGKVGGVLARTLLAANQPVRAVVRDADKGGVWAAQGCELALALAEMQDEAALTAAFEGAEAAFVLPPPNFDPEPGFPEARAIATATRNALVNSPRQPRKTCSLNTPSLKKYFVPFRSRLPF
jgi:NAD(P)H dehydrogenase (quinone)